MEKKIVLPMAFAFALCLMSCGGKKEEKNEEPKSTADALQQLTDKAKELGDKKAVDPVDFRELKGLLPETLSGIKRTEASGEKSGAMGFTVSTAKAEYREGDTSLRVEIVDTGGIAGMASMALAAWAMADIDKETENGYEKTTKLDGHKAFEQYNNQSKSGELNVLVADRYIVNVHGDNLTMDQMKSALDDIDLDKLAGLK